MTPAALAAELRLSRLGSLDIEIDYRTCEEVLRGGVIEGRQPAFMAMYARESGLLDHGAGKNNTTNQIAFLLPKNTYQNKAIYLRML